MDYDEMVLAALGERAARRAGAAPSAAADARAAAPGGVVGAGASRAGPPGCWPGSPAWLVEQVPRDHRESDAAFRRRRRVTAGVAVAGAALLGVSLSTQARLAARSTG